VHPNPATDEVSFAGLRPQHVSLFSPAGTLVYSRSSAGGIGRMPLPALPGGIYLLRLQDQETVRWTRLVIR
jgi:hypothetical protein